MRIQANDNIEIEQSRLRQWDFEPPKGHDVWFEHLNAVGPEHAKQILNGILFRAGACDIVIEGGINPWVMSVKWATDDGKYYKKFVGTLKPSVKKSHTEESQTKDQSQLKGLATEKETDTTPEPVPPQEQTLHPDPSSLPDHGPLSRRISQCAPTDIPTQTHIRAMRMAELGDSLVTENTYSSRAAYAKAFELEWESASMLPESAPGKNILFLSAIYLAVDAGLETKALCNAQVLLKELGLPGHIKLAAEAIIHNLKSKLGKLDKA